MASWPPPEKPVVAAAPKEEQENTLTCVLNLSVAFLLQLSLVVPFSVFVLVVQNWVLGSFVCYMLPMIQVRAT